MGHGAGLIALFLCGISQAQDEATGATIYYDYACYACHGYYGNGRTPLANNVSGIMVDEDVFILFLRQRAELNPMLPANSMPNYDAAVLSDEQARDLYAYIKTFKDHPPKLKDDPLMQQILEAAQAQDPDRQRRQTGQEER